MFKQEYAILIIFVAMLLAFPAAGFSVEKADKDAIMQEISGFIEAKPEVLRSIVFTMADEYQRQNKTDEAIALYEKALRVISGNEELLSRLGGSYSQKADYAKSAEIYKRLTELKPENVWYYNMLSDAYRNAKLDDKAAGVWEDLMKKSDNPDIFIQAANFYNNQNNIDKAILAVKKAIELKPDNMGYLQTLEPYYIRLEKFSDAEAVCNKVLASAKDAWMKDWANSELINLYQKQNKLAELAAKFEKELAQAPKELSGYRKLADLHQRSNEPDKAIAVYEKAIAAGLDDRDVNNRLLDLYEAANKFDNAETQIKKIIVMAPQENYLYERRANLLNKAGKKEEAKKAWGELLAKSENDANAFSRYGDRLNEWGDVEGAIAQYRKAQSLDAKNLWYTMRIADIRISKDDFSAAKKELAAIIAQTTDSWMKQDAERKIKDIEAKSNAVKAEPMKPVAAAAQAPEKPIAAKGTKPQEKKKGLLSR
jgi:tetratricopeptide (TPR) repeat protein